MFLSNQLRALAIAAVVLVYPALGAPQQVTFYGFVASNGTIRPDSSGNFNVTRTGNGFYKVDFHRDTVNAIFVVTAESNLDPPVFAAARQETGAQNTIISVTTYALPATAPRDGAFWFMAFFPRAGENPLLGRGTTDPNRKRYDQPISRMYYSGPNVFDLESGRFAFTLYDFPAALSFRTTGRYVSQDDTYFYFKSGGVNAGSEIEWAFTIEPAKAFDGHHIRRKWQAGGAWEELQDRVYMTLLKTSGT